MIARLDGRLLRLAAWLVALTPWSEQSIVRGATGVYVLLHITQLYYFFDWFGAAVFPVYVAALVIVQWNHRALATPWVFLRMMVLAGAINAAIAFLISAEIKHTVWVAKGVVWLIAVYVATLPPRPPRRRRQAVNIFALAKQAGS